MPRNTIFTFVFFLSTFSISLFGQNRFSYDFALGFKIPIIETKAKEFVVDTCYNLNRRNTLKYDRNPFLFSAKAKYLIRKKLQLGLDAEVNILKDEEFNNSSVAIFEDVLTARLFGIAEYLIFNNEEETLTFEFGIGYVFNETKISDQFWREKGGGTSSLGLNYYFGNKLKGLFLSLDYELHEALIEWDINSLFSLNLQNCEIYHYRAWRSYLNLRAGLTL